jgi:acyl dehydratase
LPDISRADETGREASVPYFDDLEVGAVSAAAPSLTLTAGHAALHQAILGSRMRLPLDAELARRVAGADRSLAHPGLVCDVAIGQSTMLTRRVIGNLFYRGLALLRLPRIGDTLTTTSEVVALRQNRPRRGRAPTGIAALRVRTVDQKARPVLDFVRAAMLPLRDPDAATGHADDLAAVGSELDSSMLAQSVEDWDLDTFRDAVDGPAFADFEPGSRWTVTGADVVSSAPELARMTLNVAFAHHDRAAGQRGERLVYGGHTIGIAAAQLTRALPGLVTIVGWHSCHHLGPVFEGDQLSSSVELERVEPLPRCGGLVHLRCLVAARRGAETVPVLDWKPVGVMA